MSLHTQHGIDHQELKDFIKGKISTRKCLDCDINGVQYWDNRYCEGLQPGPSGIPPEFLDRGSCETCHGLGYILEYRHELDKMFGSSK